MNWLAWKAVRTIGICVAILLAGCALSDPLTEIVPRFVQYSDEGQCEEAWSLIHPNREHFKAEFMNLCIRVHKGELGEAREVRVLERYNGWTDAYGVAYSSVAKLEVQWTRVNTQVVHTVRTPKGWKLLWSPDHALE